MEFAHLDERGVVKHSTKIRIALDRTGRRAARVASKLNEELELYWKSLTGDRLTADLSRYDEARRRARGLGFEYVVLNPTQEAKPHIVGSKNRPARWAAGKHIPRNEAFGAFLMSKLLEFMEGEAARAKRRKRNRTRTKAPKRGRPPTGTQKAQKQMVPRPI